MIEPTSQKVQQLVKSLSQEGHIDSMTEKWLSFTPNLPRTPVFYTLRKIHKPTVVGKPIISERIPSERIPSFVERLRHSACSAIARLVSQRYDKL